MKIAVFYHMRFSGVKRIVYEHVKGLKNLSHTIDLYVINKETDIFDPSPYADTEYTYLYSPKDFPILFLKRAKSDFDTFFLLKELHKKIASDIDSRNYDIVLVHLDHLTQAPFILRFLKTKSVYYCQEPLRAVYEYFFKLPKNIPLPNQLYEELNRQMRKRIDRKNVFAADFILTNSFHARERIIAAYDKYPKVSYLAVNEKVFRPKKIKKKNQLLFVADKLPVYGYDFAKRALELIPRKIRPELKVVEWKKNNSERLSEEELISLYNESIATLSLSRFDTFGLIPLESMACKTPVIAFNVAGYRETIADKKTGFLVDFEPEEIADKIIFFIHNPKIARKMGEEGRIWVEKQWTWKKQIPILNSYLLKFAQKENAS